MRSWYTSASNALIAFYRSLNSKNQQKNSVASFLMEDVATCVSAFSAGITVMFAVTRTGVLHIFKHQLNGWVKDFILYYVHNGQLNPDEGSDWDEYLLTIMWNLFALFCSHNSTGMIKNMLKSSKGSDTYLATFRRHHWSAQMMMKKDNYLELSASTVAFIREYGK